MFHTQPHCKIIAATASPYRPRKCFIIASADHFTCEMRSERLLAYPCLPRLPRLFSSKSQSQDEALCVLACALRWLQNEISPPLGYNWTIIVVGLEIFRYNTHGRVKVKVISKTRRVLFFPLIALSLSLSLPFVCSASSLASSPIVFAMFSTQVSTYL